ncbi:MAG: glycosyltransferase family 4 protein [Cyanobacteria bacterium J06626_18]
MNILMLSVTFPYPASRGGTEVRTFNLLKSLRQDHDITLFTLRYDGVPEADIEALAEWVSELKVFPVPSNEYDRSPLGKAARFGRFLLDGTPASTRHRQTQEIQAWIDAKAQSGQFDAVTCEHSANEVFVSPTVQAHIPRRIVDIHSSVYGTCKQQLATGTAENPLRERLNLALLKRYETQYCGKFTDLVVTTPEDAAQIRELRPDQRVHVVTNGVDLKEFSLRTQDPEGHDLVFVGAMDTPPNVDAAVYFSREVFPLLRERYDDATLYLVGTRPTPSVLALQEVPGVVVTGKVPSTTDYLHKATVCVVPLRSGYGIKNKTIEAMAAGIPVVGSDRGLEGLQIKDADGNRRALRANTPQEYVAAISQLFENLGLRQALSQNARTMIEADYTWENAGKIYAGVLSR